jgi:molybdenum cofactor synthesis domain-containing protein
MPDQRSPDSETAAPRANTASVVIIGDEVLAGEVVDLNGPFILSHLATRGIRVLGLHVLPDEPAEVESSIKTAARLADYVLVTGGIGPTHDDITRLAVARALGRPLVSSSEATLRLESIFRRGSTPEERAMALLPQGAELLLAPGIMAFGFRVQNVLVFPGVPRLLGPIFLSNLDRIGGRSVHRRELRTDLREGLIAAPLSELAARWPELRWGSYPELTETGWTLRLVLRGRNPEEVDAAFDMLEDMVIRLEARP